MSHIRYSVAVCQTDLVNPLRVERQPHRGHQGEARPPSVTAGLGCGFRTVMDVPCASPAAQSFYIIRTISSPIAYPTAATPKPTTNMSRPLAQTLRPVKRLRAAPIAKCASMLIVSDVQDAGP